MTQLHTPATGVTTPTRKRRQRWPLLATAAGLTGLVATLVLDGRTVGDEGASLDHQLFVDLDPLTFRLSMVFGYLTVVLLLVLAATWRRRVEPLLPDSTAAHLVPLGLVSSAAGLTYGYGWKGALGNYLPGLVRAHGVRRHRPLRLLRAQRLRRLDRVARRRHRRRRHRRGWACVKVPSRAGSGSSRCCRCSRRPSWSPGMGVPGVPALLGPIWLVVTGLGLYLRGSPISR